MVPSTCTLGLFLFLAAVATSSFAMSLNQEVVKVMTVEEDYSVYLEDLGHVDYGDSGQIENCGSVPFQASWTPKVVKVSGSLSFTVNYTVPHDIQSFIVNASVSYHGEPSPFINFPNTPLSCRQLSKHLACPIKAGTKYSGTFPFHDMDVLKAYIGTFDLFLQATNEKHEPLVCAKMTVNIEE